MPLTDVLACPEDQLEAIITHEECYQRGSWYLAKRAGAIELCKLGEALGIGSYDDLKRGFKLVGEPLPEGPWPETIHPRLVEKLTTITDDEIETVTREWCRIEEFHGVAKPEELAKYLKGLRSFLVANAGPFFLVNAL
jgi:hypothetical protein